MLALFVDRFVDVWEVPFEEIAELQWLGSGAQGAVFLGKFHSEEVAIKKVREQKETDIKHLRKLKHPNIIGFKYDPRMSFASLNSNRNAHFLICVGCLCCFLQGRVHTGSMLLHYHGVLCSGAAV